MNLADITTKCYILALIIRDDGERLLLGDGAYEFKDSQQHFIANTYANDVVELQGTDGQMLAGQVRRTATQTFAGYIGDATFSKQKVEAARRDFMMFFRKKHYYTAVYVFSDGTAIQRKRGYIVNAPSVPELYQRFPEWSIGLNFEDPNYYEYAEDDLGQEIAAHKVELELSTAMSGGLIWDEDGAVSDDASYVGTEIPGEGKNFQLADTGTATLKSAELLGDATQDGTPTPDAPQPVNTVTGEQTVKIEGKNLFSGDFSQFDEQGGTGTLYTYFELPTDGDYRLTLVAKNEMPTQSTSRYIGFSSTGGGASGGHILWAYSGTAGSTAGQTRSIPNYVAGGGKLKYLSLYPKTQATLEWFTENFDIQLELGSTATAYEPYQGQEFEVNLGKNLLENTHAKNTTTTNGMSFTVNDDGTITLNGTATALTWFVFHSAQLDLPDGTYTISLQGGTDTNIGVYNDKFGSTLLGSSTTRTITNASGNVSIRVASGATASNLTIKPMIERGSTATSFAPYFTPIELAGVGEIQPDGLPKYRDSFKKTDGKWYIEKQVGKVVLDGSETWTLNESGTGYVRFTTTQSGIITSFSNSQIYVISDNFTASTQTETVNANADANRVCVVSNGRLLFKTLDTSLNTVAKWQTWLSTHNTTVYYALATPTTTEITNSELVGQLERLKHAHTYADTTNFSITATSQNLPAFLKVVAFGDDAIPQGGYVWEDGGTGGATTITVDGVDNAQPIWTVVGPATNPSLTNITTGESIQWTGVVPNGQTLVVNMADMTASLSGANVFEFISGSWITLQAGNNRVSYSATAATGIATLEWNGVVG